MGTLVIRRVQWGREVCNSTWPTYPCINCHSPISLLCNSHLNTPSLQILFLAAAFPHLPLHVNKTPSYSPTPILAGPKKATKKRNCAPYPHADMQAKTQYYECCSPLPPHGPLYIHASHNISPFERLIPRDIVIFWLVVLFQ